jgi:hypothetical protein
MSFNKIKKLFAAYLNSSWIPLAVAVGTFIFCILLKNLLGIWKIHLPDLYILWAIASFLGTFSAGLYNRKKPIKGSLNIIYAFLIFLVFPFISLYGGKLMFVDLTRDFPIPKGMIFEEPSKQHTFEPNDIIKANNKIEKDIWLEEATQEQVNSIETYNVFAYINAKEAGYTYVKIFDAIKNTSLSPDTNKNKSTKRLSFSEDNNISFLYKSPVTTYEGGYGKFYPTRFPARFELWFVPDSGKEERKLLEKIFKVEGWLKQ